MKQQTLDILKEYNQEHILEYLPILSKKEEQELESQIQRINFKELQSLYETTKQEDKIEEKKIEHIAYTDKSKLSSEKKEVLETIGKDAIKKGHYGVITLAGGQGSRLGHQGPKGTYVLGTKNGPKYLFEIIVDTLKKAQKEYRITIPWYIMTSRENHEETVTFLEKENYFGYPKSKVKFFMQGELPLVDTEGRLIIDKDKKIKEAANGNGGIYQSIENSGLLKEMQENEIEWLFVMNVDNVLTNFVDPVLLGLTITEKNKIGAKSVAKTNPKEKVGVFCKQNGKPKIIEYIDLPEDMAEQVDENGELLFGEVNMANYIFHISVLQNSAKIKLPYHAAFKKNGYLQPNGEYVEPETPNVYKFEAFIFDIFERYDDISVLRVKREEEFAPVKNRTGADSPETAVKLYNAMN